MTGATKPTPIWHETFITEYLKNGGNGAQAYLKAKPGVTENTAKTNAARLLANANFITVFEAQKAKLVAKTGMTRERWLKLICDIAEFNISEFASPGVGSDVEIRPGWEQNEKAHVIEAISSSTTTTEDGQVFTKTQIKSASKIKALELLGKALGYTEERIEINHSGSVDFTMSHDSLNKLGVLRERFPLLN
jgi:hypothetical protein